MVPLATALIDKKMMLIQERLRNNQSVEGEYLTYLLSSTNMSTEDVYGNVAELLLAGVDTVVPFSKDLRFEDKLWCTM